MEQWKIIEEFPNYEISDLGRVRRATSGTHTWVGRIRKLTLDGTGYLMVSFVKKGKHHYKAVHTLVARAFIPNPRNLPEVNHTKEKTDNRVESLEWKSLAGHRRDAMLRSQFGDGVSFNTRTGKFKAGYFLDAKWVHLGYFFTQDEALAARRAAVKEIPWVL